MKAFLACCLLLVAVYQTEAYEQKPISVLLKECKCDDNHHFCRIIRGCKKSEPFEASCVGCVPPGTDDHCRLNGFYKTVLLGNPHDTTSITPMGCRVHKKKNQCPNEAVCVPLYGYYGDQTNLGICCHNPMPEPDKQCAANCKRWDECHCKMGEECELKLHKCGKFSKACVQKVNEEELEPVAF